MSAILRRADAVTEVAVKFVHLSSPSLSLSGPPNLYAKIVSCTRFAAAQDAAEFKTMTNCIAHAAVPSMQPEAADFNAKQMEVR